MFISDNNGIIDPSKTSLLWKLNSKRHALYRDNVNARIAKTKWIQLTYAILWARYMGHDTRVYWNKIWRSYRIARNECRSITSSVSDDLARVYDSRWKHGIPLNVRLKFYKLDKER